MTAVSRQRIIGDVRLYGAQKSRSWAAVSLPEQQRDGYQLLAALCVPVSPANDRFFVLHAESLAVPGP